MKKEEKIISIGELRPVNIAVVGDPKCGKTCLIDCFLTENFETKNTDTILNITKTKISAENHSLDINIFDLSGYKDRDKELIADYIKNANIILLCHSFDQDFNEESIKAWLEFINQKTSNNRNIYLLGCKYDTKVMIDYQKGSKITSLMFQNENLTSFGERIKTFINQPQINIKSYFLVSALLNFNIKEMFRSVIKDHVYDEVVAMNKSNGKTSQNCTIF